MSAHEYTATERTQNQFTTKTQRTLRRNQISNHEWTRIYANTCRLGSPVSNAVQECSRQEHAVLCSVAPVLSEPKTYFCSRPFAVDRLALTSCPLCLCGEVSFRPCNMRLLQINRFMELLIALLPAQQVSSLRQHHFYIRQFYQRCRRKDLLYACLSHLSRNLGFRHQTR